MSGGRTTPPDHDPVPPSGPDSPAQPDPGSPARSGPYTPSALSDPSDPDPAAPGAGGVATAAEWVEREEARLRGATRAVRGMFAGILCMEAFTVALVPGVVAKFGSGLTAVKLTVLLGLAAVLVVVAFLLRRPSGVRVASALQVAVVACGVFATAMYGLGAIYLAIWLYALRVRYDLLTRRPPPPELR